MIILSLWMYSNVEPTDTTFSDFCEIYNLKDLVKDKTCFKNRNKTSCIDLIITKKPKRFQTSIKTGLYGNMEI